MKDIPHLIVWGDNVAQSELWTKLSKASIAYHQALKDAGGKASWISLPEAGVKGNTHMMMMDTNSDQVAGLIQKWMTEQGLMK